MAGIWSGNSLGGWARGECKQEVACGEKGISGGEERDVSISLSELIETVKRMRGDVYAVHGRPEGTPLHRRTEAAHGWGRGSSETRWAGGRIALRNQRTGRDILVVELDRKVVRQ